MGESLKGGERDGMARAGLQEVVRADRLFSLQLGGGGPAAGSAAAIYLTGLPETADRGSRQRARQRPGLLPPSDLSLSFIWQTC